MKRVGPHGPARFVRCMGCIGAAVDPRVQVLAALETCRGHLAAIHRVDNPTMERVIVTGGGVPAEIRRINPAVRVEVLGGLRCRRDDAPAIAEETWEML